MFQEGEVFGQSIPESGFIFAHAGLRDWIISSGTLTGFPRDLGSKSTIWRFFEPAAKRYSFQNLMSAKGTTRNFIALASSSGSQKSSGGRG